MKRISLPILPILCWALLCGGLWSDGFEVLSTAGEVLYRAPGSFDKVPVAAGQKLAEKGRLSMAAGAELNLRSPTGDEIGFRDKSYIVLSKLEQDGQRSNTQIDLFQGKIQVKVQKLEKESSFIVKTPSAVAGVRGTLFVCEVSVNGSTQVIVLVGEVGMRDPGGRLPAASVMPGQVARVSPGGIIVVRTVPALLQMIQQLTAQKKADGPNGGGKPAPAQGDGPAAAGTGTGPGAEAPVVGVVDGAAGDAGLGESLSLNDLESGGLGELLLGTPELNIELVEVLLNEILDPSEITDALLDEVSEAILDELQLIRDEETLLESNAPDLDVLLNIENISR